MLSNFFVIGRLGEKVNSNKRYIEVERNYKNSGGQFDLDLFLASHWSKQENNFFMTAEKGTIVAARGHLETISPGQIVLYIENLDFFAKNANNGLLIDNKQLDL